MQFSYIVDKVALARSFRFLFVISLIAFMSLYTVFVVVLSFSAGTVLNLATNGTIGEAAEEEPEEGE
jgi:hypothetical protein